MDDHFFWTYTEEPHRSRRQAIIKAHPEVCFDFTLILSSFEAPGVGSPGVPGTRPVPVAGSLVLALHR